MKNDALQALLPIMEGVEIATYVSNEEDLNTIKAFIEEHQGEHHNLKEHDLKALPFTRNVFEAIIFDDAQVCMQEEVARELSRVLHKSYSLLVLSTEKTLQELQAVYEPIGFSNFSEIDDESRKIFMLKQWFTFAQ